MSKIIVISICERSIRLNGLRGYEFKFIGVFQGIDINKINVTTNVEHSIGQKYLLYLSINSIESKYLYANLEVSKELKKNL